MTTRLSADPEQLALAARVRAGRLASGLTQQELADRVRIGRTALAEIEGARRGVEALEGLRLAKALGMPLDELLEMPAVSPEVLELVDGLTAEQVDELTLFAEYLLWRRRRPPMSPHVTPTTGGMPDFCGAETQPAAPHPNTA